MSKRSFTKTSKPIYIPLSQANNKFEKMSFKTSKPIYTTIPLSQANNIFETPLNIHSYDTAKNETILSWLQIVCAVIAPSIFLALFVSCFIIYHERPISVTDIFVDGFTKTTFSLCPNEGENIKLVILVASPPGNLERRIAIRRSWGSYATRDDVAVAFVLGQPLGINTELVDMEDKLYQDIIITNNPDTYQYLTLKTLSMMKWVQKYCSKAKHMMKTDDDVFINIPAWLDVANFNETKTIWSHKIWYNLGTCRDNNLKSYVPSKEYESETLPVFGAGEGYMMTSDCIELLLKASFKAKYLRLEDVFVGLMAKEVGVKYRNVFSVHENNFFVQFVYHQIRSTLEQLKMWRLFKSFKDKVKHVKFPA